MGHIGFRYLQVKVFRLMMLDFLKFNKCHPCKLFLSPRKMSQDFTKANKITKSAH